MGKGLTFAKKLCLMLDCGLLVEIVCVCVCVRERERDEILFAYGEMMGFHHVTGWIQLVDAWNRCVFVQHRTYQSLSAQIMSKFVLTSTVQVVIYSYPLKLEN